MVAIADVTPATPGLWRKVIPQAPIKTRVRASGACGFTIEFIRCQISDASSYWRRQQRRTKSLNGGQTMNPNSISTRNYATYNQGIPAS